MADRFELRHSLPESDWNQYQKGMPVYSRDGQYLGRDAADSIQRSWQSRMLDIALVAAGVSYSFILDSRLVSPLWIAGAAILTPKAYDKLERKFNRAHKIINPII